MEEYYVKVNPIIEYPICIKAGMKQDCFNCRYQKNNLCKSTRALCIKPYHGHKKGCPNYGRYNSCPPNTPMFDEVFRMDKDIYFIYYAYDIKLHMDKMKNKHPNWSDRQLRNVLYWQGTAKKLHKEKVKEFLKEYGQFGYEVMSPEASGVDVTKTLENVGIILEWPPINKSYRVAIAGIPKEGKSTRDLPKDKNNKLTSYH